MNKVKKLLLDLNPLFEELIPFIEENIKKLNSQESKDKELFSCKDTMLITYADQFHEQGKNNFQALNDFIVNDLKNCVSIVHLLPFYPWTSDDGFSPVDYKEVCEEYGTWDDLREIKAKKMFDCVFNHISSKSKFFEQALNGDEQAQKMFFIVNEEEYLKDEFQENIKKVVRPRTLPLFTPYEINGETKYVWTTFSPDQVDTNLENPQMLRYVLESFFHYIEEGAQYFRIDAVPFMWKELGTNCSHLPKTHKLVQLFRAIIDEFDQNLYIVTESNVPHHENISYWGNGKNEAHVIYNFSLAPLILHALNFKTTKYLNEWAKSVFDIEKETTFLNFTATHDGIGMRGLEGVVPEEDVTKLCEIAQSKGGEVGKKVSRDGTIRPYELNITWASMLEEASESEELYISKVVNSHAIVTFFPGIGAHYVHNFLGTKNWDEGYKESGIPRRLNRQKLTYPLELNRTQEEIKRRLIELIDFKGSNDLFSPKSGFEILDLHESVLCFRRFNESSQIKVLFNLTAEVQKVEDVTLEGYQLHFE